MVSGVGHGVIAPVDFAHLFHNSPDMQALVDPMDGRITLCNETFAVRTGFSRAELEGRTLLQLCDAESSEEARRALQDLARGEDPANVELLVKIKDGARIPVLVSLRGFRNDEGRIAFGLTVWRDTRFLARADAPEKLKTDLARSNEDLDRFAYIASHDLQEPLRMVSSYTQLLAQRYAGQLDEKADKYIAYVVDGAQRMQSLIKDVLLVSTVGRSSAHFRPVELAEACRKALRELAEDVRVSDALVDVETLPVVEGDPVELELVFRNLIGNALKFRADAAPRVEVGATARGDFWEVRVKDNGLGFEPKDAEFIFGMFRKLHASHRYPGSGIGLALVQKVARSHRGRAWAEGALGRGATFYFSIPRSRTEPSPGV